MKKIFAVPLVCAALAAGCASSAQMRHVEEKSSANQQALRETDRRLHTLEQSVATLDSQMAQIRNRSFEVRTRGGKKTGMTVVPILPPAAPAVSVPGSATAAAVSATPGQAVPPVAQDAALGKHGPEVTAAPVVHAAVAAPVAAAPLTASSGAGANTSKIPASPPAASSAASEAPKGRVIDPAAPVRPFPSAAVAAGSAGPIPRAPEAAHASGQSAKAGPSGTVGKTTKTQVSPGNEEASPLGLPPVAAPEPSTPPAVDPVNFAAPNAGQPAVPTGGGKGDPAGGNAAVPVPQLPPSTLALPPEHPGLPPVEAPAASMNATASPAAPAGTAPGTPAGTPVVPAAASIAGAAQKPVRPGKGEKAAYEAALKVVMAGRSAEGISRFETFLQEYPQGTYAPNAEYWIGEGLYAQGKYREALAQFRKVDASYPQHHKNADALLKTGMCLSRLGDKEAAGQAYGQLLSRFPKSEAARLARARGLAR
ncbi:tol-pal system protein YbgF [Desulfovibrio sp.]|uniref:tol-pal system protein YbgF n=1 Tax=Desulfovibrio sp. TaxID=885 RepID=UPI0025C40CF9|nr:tol-pal system protein YbgF [Desulfovibrio sp.]